MKAFLKNILLFSLLIASPSFGITIADSDYMEMVKGYTQYRNSYNRTIENFRIITNAMNREDKMLLKVVEFETNYRHRVELRLAEKEKELRNERIRSGILLGVLSVLEVAILWAIGSGVLRK